MLSLKLIGKLALLTRGQGRRRQAFALIALSALSMAAADLQSAKAATAKKPFTVYYTLRFTQPVTGFEQCGLTLMPIIHQGALFKNSIIGSSPDYTQIKKTGVRTVQAGLVASQHKLAVLDVEGSWSLQPTDSLDTMKSKATNYNDVLNYLKLQLQAAGTPARLGYFEVAPPSFYQSPSWPGQPLTPYEQAVAALDTVARSSDALSPQLYGYLTPEHFKAYTMGTVKTARSRWPDKPIYPFIWMQRRKEQTVSGAPYTHELLPKGAFRIQLDTVKASGAEGTVIWGTLGDTQPRLDWNKNADWWLETKAFLVAQGVNMKNCKL